MSVDIDIGDKEFNLTYNYAYMYYMDNTNMVREMDGMLASAAKQVLKHLRQRVERNYMAFQEAEHENCKGWGTVEQYYRHLGDMILACEESPDEIVSVR